MQHIRHIPFFERDFEISTINTHKNCERSTSHFLYKGSGKGFISVSYLYKYIYICIYIRYISIHINIRSPVAFPAHVEPGNDFPPFPKPKSWKLMRPRWPCIRIRRNVPGKRDLTPKKRDSPVEKDIYPSGQKRWRLDEEKWSCINKFPPSNWPGGVLCTPFL